MPPRTATTVPDWVGATSQVPAPPGTVPPCLRRSWDLRVPIGRRGPANPPSRGLAGPGRLRRRGDGRRRRERRPRPGARLPAGRWPARRHGRCGAGSLSPTAASPTGRCRRCSAGTRPSSAPRSQSVWVSESESAWESVSRHPGPGRSPARAGPGRRSLRPGARWRPVVRSRRPTPDRSRRAGARRRRAVQPHHVPRGASRPDCAPPTAYAMPRG